MKILKLTLENFQGIKQAEYIFNGQNANIYGKNATGKTSIFNAFTWLIFGCSSSCSSDFTPKTKDENGSDEHKLDHQVECEMEINGEVVIFKRIFREVWKKPRGNTNENMTGHTTEYFINGIPKKAKEYERYWEDIFNNKELPKILSKPSYFSEVLHWEKRRAILLEMGGNIPDSEIIETDSELKELALLIGNNTIDEYKKMVKTSLTEINRNMQSIPARIDEANKAILEFVGPDLPRYTSISDIQKDLDIAYEELAKAEQNPPKISELELQLSEARRIHSIKQQEETEKLYKKISNIRKNLSDAETLLSNNRRIYEQAKSNVETIERKRSHIFAEHAKKQEEYSRIISEIFDETAVICNACGQDLPQNKVNEIKEAFNLNKSNRLILLTQQMNALVEQGRQEASKEMLAAAIEKVTDAEVKVSSAQTSVELLNSQLLELENAIKQDTSPAFETTNEYITIMEQITFAKSESQNRTPNTSDIDNKILQYQMRVKSLNSAKSRLELEIVQRERQEERISNLKKVEQELAKEYEKAKFALYLCEKFNRAKAKLLTEKINKRFSAVSFQLFEKNITNDSIEDVCNVLVLSDKGKLVPYADTNNAARINAGLEIIETLGKHYGINLPVFIDNAESINEIKGIDCQLIALIVSKLDEKIRIELNESNEKENKNEYKNE